MSRYRPSWKQEQYDFISMVPGWVCPNSATVEDVMPIPPDVYVVRLPDGTECRREKFMFRQTVTSEFLLHTNVNIAVFLVDAAIREARKQDASFTPIHEGAEVRVVDDRVPYPEYESVLYGSKHGDAATW